MPVNIRSFRRKVSYHAKAFRRFLARVERRPPANLDALVDALNAEVWQEIDCTSCGNCCKQMSPTFSAKDIKRIAGYTGMSIKEFKKKWLHQQPNDTDWMNKTQPCQFLNKASNLCSIYEVRPADCAEFPHLTKKKVTDYLHIHQQNIQYCPATYKMVEKMMVRIDFKAGVERFKKVEGL